MNDNKYAIRNLASDPQRSLYHKILVLNRYVKNPNHAKSRLTVITLTNTADVEDNRGYLISWCDTFENELESYRERFAGIIPSDPKIRQALFQLGEIREIRKDLKLAERRLAKVKQIRKKAEST